MTNMNCRRTCRSMPVMVETDMQSSLACYRPCEALRNGTLFSTLNKPLRHRCCHRREDEDAQTQSCGCACENGWSTANIIDEETTQNDECRCDWQDNDDNCCPRRNRCCDDDDDDDECCPRERYCDHNDDDDNRCCPRERCCDHDDDDDNRCRRQRCCNDESTALINQREDRCCRCDQRQQANNFALWELRLYLDTHPWDTQARAMLRQLNERCDQPGYATAFLPHRRRNGGCENSLDTDGCWRWLDEPWPWEHRCCRED